MPVTGIVRPSLERQRAILRCRFVIGAFHRPDQLERARNEAADRFVADMAKQGWEWLGRMALVGGPYPMTPIATSVPKAPTLPKRQLGPSSLAPDPYPSLRGIVADMPTIYTAEAWEYEIAGAFVRPLAPIEVLDTDLPEIEARAARRRRSKRA